MNGLSASMHASGASTNSSFASPALLLTNGRVIDPASNTDMVADVAVDGGLIAAIGPKLPRVSGAEVIDCQGRLVVPGLIDPHVHLREPGQEHKETIATGTRSAACGGFTTVCCMPNTSPAIDTPELVRFVHDRARPGESARARVFAVAAATRGRKGEELAEIALMARRKDRAGAVAFSDDGDCIASAGMMARVLHACAAVDAAFMQHAQEPTLTRGGVMHAGAVATRLGLGGWPRVAEEIIVERDVRLNRSAGARYHVQHISSAGTVEILRRAREDWAKQGLRGSVTGEASPHHLILTHERCDGYDTQGKVNPPLRETADVRALRQGVADGVITVLATDHAPHAADEKALPFDEAPFGFVGLETALPLYAEALVATGAIDWPRLIALLTIEPAKLCGLTGIEAAPAGSQSGSKENQPGLRGSKPGGWGGFGDGGRFGLGALAVGGPADVTVIDPEVRWTVDAAKLASKSRNTPFHGRELKGRAVMTIVAGAIMFRGG